MSVETFEIAYSLTRHTSAQQTRHELAVSAAARSGGLESVQPFVKGAHETGAVLRAAGGALYRLGQASGGFAEDDFSEGFLASRNLADRTPALTAHSLRHCSEVSANVVRIVADRLAGQPPGRTELRLLLDLMLAAWHRALETWISSEDLQQGRAALTRHIQEAFAAIPAVAAHS